jgi:hypothetical protein
MANEKQLVISEKSDRSGATFALVVSQAQQEDCMAMFTIIVNGSMVADMQVDHRDVRALQEALGELLDRGEIS